jgi:hypothetical protein
LVPTPKKSKNTLPLFKMSSPERSQRRAEYTSDEMDDGPELNQLIRDTIPFEKVDRRPIPVFVPKRRRSLVGRRPQALQTQTPDRGVPNSGCSDTKPVQPFRLRDEDPAKGMEFCLRDEDPSVSMVSFRLRDEDPTLGMDSFRLRDEDSIVGMASYRPMDEDPTVGAEGQPQGAQGTFHLRDEDPLVGIDDGSTLSIEGERVGNSGPQVRSPPQIELWV